jgi:hypothetical protein
MMSLLLPCATVEVSLIAGWCWIGATPRGEPQMPAMMLPYGGRGSACAADDGVVDVPQPFMGRPVARQLMRNALLDLTTIMPVIACHRRTYAERYSRSIRWT